MAAPEPPVLAYIGLGSNLDDPRAQVARAMDELAGLPGCTLAARSSLYATAPVGPVAQPDFVNAVVALATTLAPLALLGALQGLERDHGRVRDGTRWGPRTLDLDLLLFGDLQIHLPGLVLPHPEMRRRAFVLVPLAEIAPGGLPIPGQGPLAELLAALDDRDWIRPVSTGAGAPGALSSR
ncbi:2-amino-4-hydroxy-6-hydroxymethyldihydropteridine diphosphokinase [uncultured Thiodictyon sp.]|uniref:2-amino-4-hydroxy-6- hydroxymethyldihydropteridine diphosphokinase n=1 Tax=uncultured Thiodictyon sp. TaxID=1846217 RepID=UPI0025D44AAB|nr:2-amino-4-hydroxy-6-hydroxymethyldihydropteridine diphosphokinase [uncultured Thiodictyon sp.]